MAEDDRKIVLKTELAAARERITTNLQALRFDLDFRTRAKRAFARSPIPWIAGASIIGLLVARLAFRRTKVVVTGKTKERVEKVEKAGLLVIVLKLVFDLIRPALTKWVTGFIADYAKGRMGASRR